MKKFVLASVCALSLLGLYQQRASAWCNFNFSTGFNVGFQSGGWERNGGGCQRSWGDPGCAYGAGMGSAMAAPQSYYPLANAGGAGFQPSLVGSAATPAAPAGASFSQAPTVNELSVPKSQVSGNDSVPAGYHPVSSSANQDGQGYRQAPISRYGR